MFTAQAFLSFLSCNKHYVLTKVLSYQKFERFTKHIERNHWYVFACRIFPQFDVFQIFPVQNLSIPQFSESFFVSFLLLDKVRVFDFHFLQNEMKKFAHPTNI